MWGLPIPDGPPNRYVCFSDHERGIGPEPSYICVLERGDGGEGSARDVPEGHLLQAAVLDRFARAPEPRAEIRNASVEPFGVSGPC